MEFNAHRVSPSPQELDAWLRSTELENDGSSSDVDAGGLLLGGSSIAIGVVSPEIGYANNLELEGSEPRLYDDFISQHPNEFRLPFMQELEHRRESPGHSDGTNNLGSPRTIVSSSDCFIRALERSQQSQAEINRFDSDDLGHNSFNAALMTTRSRRMLLDSALCTTSSPSTSEIIHNNHNDRHRRRAASVAIGEEDNLVLSPLPQYPKKLRMNEGMNMREESWTHRDMLNMLRSMVDDDTATMITSDTNTREDNINMMWRLSAYTGSRDLRPEDEVRAELLRIEREQREYEEAQLGL